jgi:hypothetical protein
MTRPSLAGLIVLLAACGTTGTDGPRQGRGREQLAALELRSGSSFGMCGGYCVTELVIDTLGVTLTETSQVQPLPPRTRTLPLSDADWERLAEVVDTGAIRGIAGVHGCPDCADGGAEWIQFGPASEAVRVTFEFGDMVDGVGPLQTLVRELRSRFDPL